MDTSQKHICGASGRLSESFVSFCPDHERAAGLAFLDLSLLGTLLWWLYSACVALMVLVCYALMLILLGGLLVWPISLSLPKESRPGVMRGLVKASTALAILPTLVSCVAYVWW